MENSRDAWQLSHFKTLDCLPISVPLADFTGFTLQLSSQGTCLVQTMELIEKQICLQTDTMSVARNFIDTSTLATTRGEQFFPADD